MSTTAKFPSPCGERVVPDKQVALKPAMQRRWVSVPLRGKGCPGPGGLTSQSIWRLIVWFPSPCGERVVPDYFVDKNQEVKKSFRPLAGKGLSRTTLD